MKITKVQLMQIIKEELNEISSKQGAHDERMSNQKAQRAKKETQAQEVQQVLGNDWVVHIRMLEDRYQLVVEPQPWHGQDEDKDDFFSDREANPHDDSMYGEPEGGY